MEDTEIAEKKRRKLTVKQAAKDFFEGTVSEALLYKELPNIPHVRMSSGKILFDTEQLELWWQNKLKESIKIQGSSQEELPNNSFGKLRKIAE